MRCARTVRVGGSPLIDPELVARSCRVACETPHREALDPEGRVLEIFYETVWDPRSPIGEELAALADRLVQPRR